MRGNRGFLSTTVSYSAVGNAHLLLAVVVNAVTGISLLYVAGSEAVIQTAFLTLERYVTAQTVLRDAELIVVVASRGVTIAGILILVIGVCIPLLGRLWNRGHRSRWRVAADIGTAINPLALPPACIGMTLIYLDQTRLSGEDPLSADGSA